MNRDPSPIDQKWIQDYCDQFLSVVKDIPTGPFRDAVLHRIECIMDLLEAWQKRNLPMNKR